MRAAIWPQILMLIDRWDSEETRFLGREEKSNLRLRWVSKDFWNKIVNTVKKHSHIGHSL